MPLVISTDKTIDCRTALKIKDLTAIVKGEVEHKYMLANVAYDGETPNWRPEVSVYTNMHAEILGLPINMRASRRLKMENNPVRGTIVLCIGPPIKVEVTND